MDNVLREILRENQFFEEMNENRFVPEYLGLIVNGVVIYNVNWVDIVDKEVLIDRLEINIEWCEKARIIWKKMQRRRLSRG